MVDHRTQLTVALFITILAVAAGGFAAMAAADHGSPANFTVYPQENADRSPGKTDANYVMSSAGSEAFESDGLEVVDYYWLEAEQANFDDCSPDNARVFGIDRGNNNSGTQTDDDLLSHMKDYSIEGNRIELDLYGEDDIGDSTYLNPPDATIAVLADCIENTGDAGWYQFQGYVNGTTYEGDYEEIQLDSHYFWIGDYESEEEAREELGPPPSEGGDGDAESTPEPDEETESSGDDGAGDDGSDAGDGDADNGTADGDADDGSADGDADDGSASEDDDGAGDSGADDSESDDSESDGTDGADEDGAATDQQDETDGADDADGAAVDDDGSTPSGDGPGFGAVAALVALLSSGALLNRRR